MSNLGNCAGFPATRCTAAASPPRRASSRPSRRCARSTPRTAPSSGSTWGRSPSSTSTATPSAPGHPTRSESTLSSEELHVSHAPDSYVSNALFLPSSFSENSLLFSDDPDGGAQATTRKTSKSLKRERLLQHRVSFLFRVLHSLRLISMSWIPRISSATKMLSTFERWDCGCCTYLFTNNDEQMWNHQNWISWWNSFPSIQEKT